MTSAPIFAGHNPSTEPDGGFAQFDRASAYDAEPFGPPVQNPYQPASPQSPTAQAVQDYQAERTGQPPQPQSQPGPNGETVPAMLTPQEAQILQRLQQASGQPANQVTHIPGQGTFAGGGQGPADPNAIPQGIPTELTEAQYLELMRRAQQADQAEAYRQELDRMRTQTTTATETAQTLAALQQYSNVIGQQRANLLNSALNLIRNGGDPEQVMVEFYKQDGFLHGQTLQSLYGLDNHYRNYYTQAIGRMSVGDYAAQVAEEHGLPEHYANELVVLSDAANLPLDRVHQRMSEVAATLQGRWQQESLMLNAMDQMRREMAAGSIAASGATRPPQGGQYGGGAQPAYSPGSVDAYNALEPFRR